MVFYNANVGNSAAGNEDLIVNLPPPDYEEIAGAQALPRNDGEKQRIEELCGEMLTMALNENTTTNHKPCDL